MRATLDHAVARQIIANGLWPDMRPDKSHQPHVNPNGNVVTFFCWDESNQRQIPCSKIKEDGKYRGPRRNITTLIALAAEHGLELNCVILPPQPPTPKKPRPVTQVDPNRTAKPDYPRKQPKTAVTTKSTMSLRDILNAKKNKQPA